MFPFLVGFLSLALEPRRKLPPLCRGGKQVLSCMTEIFVAFWWNPR